VRSLSTAAAALRAAGDAVDSVAYARAGAVGVGTDDPADPRCIVIWRDDREIYCGVAPGLRELPPDQLEDVVRGVRLLARGSWLAQVRGVSLI